MSHWFAPLSPGGLDMCIRYGKCNGGIPWMYGNQCGLLYMSEEEMIDDRMMGWEVA